MRPLSNYIHSAPSAQNALDIFSGEWTSLLPDEFNGLRAGTLPLFVDPRLTWAIDDVGGLNGKRVLELGPLEGAHSYMLEKAGARDVVAVESNASAFLRCLVLKEIFALRRVSYLCGDFAEYLKVTTDNFDFVVASGVLYHQIEPMQLIADIARVSSAVYIWTHYYDEKLVRNNPALKDRVGTLEPRAIRNLSYSQAEYLYQESLDWSGSCGGTHSSAFWVPRNDIINGLEHFGFRNLKIAFDEPEHKHGPSMALVARK